MIALIALNKINSLQSIKMIILSKVIKMITPGDDDHVT